MMNNKEREDENKKIQANNSVFLKGFEAYLTAKSVAPKTIQKHVSNINFFANTYLLRFDDMISVENGSDEIGMFLGDFFIRKVMWASKVSINENIASFKKFYTYLNEIGALSSEDLEIMKLIIKEEKEYWLEALETGESPYY